jgi:uncharacterized protein (UPF0332 family)
MEEKDKHIMIQYRLDQAKESINEVNRLIEADLLKVAVTRIYYGIFYCLSAIALKYGFKSSKHLQLIGWFNQKFVKTGLVDIKYGRILRDAFKNRSDGDYVPYTTFDINDVKKMEEEMKDFINTLTSFINSGKKTDQLF